MEEIESVRVRKSEVEHDECGLRLLDLRAGLRRGPRVLHDELRVPQIERDELSYRRIVFDDHDARGHGRNAKRDTVPHL